MKKLLMLLLLLTNFAAISQTYNVGDAVNIEWKGKWFPGKILEVNKSDFKVSYDGYGADWYENVTASRLQKLVVNEINHVTEPTNVTVDPNATISEASFKGVETIWDLQMSYDGKYVLAASAYGRVMVLNPTDLTLAMEIKFSDSPVSSFSMSYDGNYIAAGDAVGKFIIYKKTSELEYAEYYTYTDYSSVGKIKFSPTKNELVVCASPKKDYTIQYVDVWNVEEKKIKFNLLNAKMSDYVIGDISFPKDGSKIALANSNKKKGIEIYDLTTGKLSLRIDTKFDVVGIAFSPDGGIIASGGTDKSVTLWNLSNKTQIWNSKWHDGTDAYVHGIAFAPNGLSIAVCGRGSGSKIKIYSIATGIIKNELSPSNPVGNAICFSPNSNIVYVALTTYGDIAKVPIVYMTAIPK